MAADNDSYIPPRSDVYIVAVYQDHLYKKMSCDTVNILALEKNPVTDEFMERLTHIPRPVDPDKIEDPHDYFDHLTNFTVKQNGISVFQHGYQAWIRHDGRWAQQWAEGHVKEDICGPEDESLPHYILRSFDEVTYKLKSMTMRYKPFTRNGQPYSGLALELDSGGHVNSLYTYQNDPVLGVGRITLQNDTLQAERIINDEDPHNSMNRIWLGSSECSELQNTMRAMGLFKSNALQNHFKVVTPLEVPKHADLNEFFHFDGVIGPQYVVTKTDPFPNKLG